MTPEKGAMPFLVTLGHTGSDSLYLRFPPEYREEIAQLLDDADIEHGMALEMSADAQLAIETVAVLGAVGYAAKAALSSLASVIETFAQRNSAKCFVVKDGDSEFELSGMSSRQIEKFLEKRATEQAALDERWNEMMRKELGEAED